MKFKKNPMTESSPLSSNKTERQQTFQPSVLQMQKDCFPFFFFWSLKMNPNGT